MIALFLFPLSIAAINVANYPAPMRIPPGQSSWTAAALANSRGSEPIVEKCIDNNSWAITVRYYKPQVNAV